MAPQIIVMVEGDGADMTLGSQSQQQRTDDGRGHCIMTRIHLELWSCVEDQALLCVIFFKDVKLTFIKFLEIGYPPLFKKQN